MNQKLFNYFAANYGLTLLQSEMDDIRRLVIELQWEQRDIEITRREAAEEKLKKAKLQICQQSKANARKNKAITMMTAAHRALMIERDRLKTQRL